MVSVTATTSGQAINYYQRDNYYTKQEGQWQGKGAEALGLQGEVKEKDFVEMIGGFKPGTLNEQQIKEFRGLVKEENKLTSAIESAKKNGDNEKLRELTEKVADYNQRRTEFNKQFGDNAPHLVVNTEGVLCHRAGVDLTFSAPKSVSIASEVLGDTRVKEAHDKAVSETLKYVEAHFSQARQTQNGITEKVDTGNLVIAKFQHDTSRELDPQLHTHAVVMNMTQREDGQWRALSNEQLFEQKMLIGQIYRNELAKNLTELGYSIQSDNKGLFEIQGIDQKLIDHFSQRSEQIDAKVKELKESGQYENADPQKLREIATLGSRVAKKDVDMNIVRESWNERLQSQGYTREQVQESIQKAAEQAKQNEQNRTEPKPNEYDIIRQATQIKTEQESTFTKEDVLKTAGKLSVGEHRIADLERAFTELNKDKEIKQLDKNVFTTKEMQKIERDIVHKVQNGHDSVNSISTKEQVEQSIKAFEAQRGFTMTRGQKDAVEHILTSKDRYIGIQGDAGTGKTTMLASVREQLERQGYHARGLGFTGKAAAEVEAQAGIKSQTIDSFLAKGQRIEGQTMSYHFGKLSIEHHEGIKQGKEVWIVDEASMLGSQKMHELMKAAERADARIVFVGDTKQLQAVEAGRMFGKLQETGDLKTVRMSEVTRQKDAGYKDISETMAEKRIDRAFDKLENQKRIQEISDRQERLNAIVKDYTGRDYKNTIIVTARNADRNELNQSIRAELKQQGKIEKNEHTFTVRESKNLSPEAKHFAQSYSEGDRVIANEAGIIGRAGREAKVTAVDHQTHKLTVQTKDGKEYDINLKRDGQNLAAYSEKQQSFARGDKVAFLKNDKSLNVKNGQIGEIKSIDRNGRAVIKMENGRDKTINLKTQYNYIDHGYAVTDYKSQGQTSKEVIYHADSSKGVNYNQAYVAMTRGKHDLKVYTDNKENFKEQMKHEQQKNSTLDHQKVERMPRIEHPTDRKVINLEIEKSKFQREVLGQLRDSHYGGGAIGKLERLSDRLLNKIPVSKQIIRGHEKAFGNFSYDKTLDLMEKREEAFKKGDFKKAHTLGAKIDKEMEKMDPKERRELERLTAEKFSEKSEKTSKSVSAVSKSETKSETLKQVSETSETKSETLKRTSEKSSNENSKTDSRGNEKSEGKDNSKSSDSGKEIEKSR